MVRKYFFFDIDGTLMVGFPPDQYLPDSARYALDALRAQGHFVAIATGRSAPMAAPILHRLGLKDMVHDGGNGITLNDELLEVRPLDREKCLALIDECDRKNIPWSFSPYNNRDRISRDDRFRRVTGDTYMNFVVIPDLDPASYPEIFKMYIACPYPVEHELETLKYLTWCRYGPDYFFVEPTDKAVGIRRVIEMIGGNTRDVVVFGDSLNDLTMFDPEWTSIAMGNGTDELKAKATYVTDDNDKDGIYKACLHFGWIPPMN